MYKQPGSQGPSPPSVAGRLDVQRGGAAPSKVASTTPVGAAALGCRAKASERQGPKADLLLTFIVGDKTGHKNTGGSGWLAGWLCRMICRGAAKRMLELFGHVLQFAGQVGPKQRMTSRAVTVTTHSADERRGDGRMDTSATTH